MIKITDSIVIYDTPELLEVSGRELAASDIIPAIGARKIVRIMADKFHLNGKLTVPQGEVTLMARHIIGGDGAEIDVSGINGRDAPDVSKPKPVDPRGPAPHGMNGPEVGGDAGTIVLVALRFDGSCSLIANGGRGSRGQPGGDAADGAHGWPDGVDNKEGWPSFAACLARFAGRAVAFVFKSGEPPLIPLPRIPQGICLTKKVTVSLPPPLLPSRRTIANTNQITHSIPQYRAISRWPQR